MAVSIASAKFSFHRFEPVDYVLPAYRSFDAAFQFVVNGFLPIGSSLYLKACDAYGTPVNAFSVDVNAVILGYKFKIPNSIFNLDEFFINSVAVNGLENNYNRSYSYAEFKQLMFDDFGFTIGTDNTFISNTLDEIVIRWAVNDVPILENTLQPFWGRGYVAATGDYIYPFFRPGDCFGYCIIDSDGNVVGRTNKLKVITSDKFTSLLTYQNNEDAFEFIYDQSNPNIVRLAFYLSRPQWPEKKTIYVKSNGQHKLLSSFIEEQYELRTEYMPAKAHRFMKMAFSHDSVIIDCSNLDETPVEVVNSDSYNPTWDPDIDLKTAPGKSTITVAAFGYNNSNFDQPETECAPPLMTFGIVTESSIRLLFQYPPSVKSILINYRKVGDSEWQGTTFFATNTFVLDHLYAGADYEVKAASNCGSSYGSFGRSKSFKTLGAAGCTPPNNLALADIGDNQQFHFVINLPLPAPASIELFQTRPDNSLVLTPVSTSGFTTNPFAFNYTDPLPLQMGLNKFQARSVCGPTDKSAYSNEIVENYQVAFIETTIQNDFQLFAGNSGSMVVKRNGSSVINTNANLSTSFNTIQNDTIDVSVSSSNGAAAHLKVYTQAMVDNTTATLFDSASSSNPVQSFSFTVDIGFMYFITSSI